MNIDKHINDILNGTEDLPQFNQPEHAGVCSAGPLLIGALIVCDFTRKSLSAGGNAGEGETSPAIWEIDEAQERTDQKWAGGHRDRYEVNPQSWTQHLLFICEEEH